MALHWFGEIRSQSLFLTGFFGFFGFFCIRQCHTLWDDRVVMLFMPAAGARSNETKRTKWIAFVCVVKLTAHLVVHRAVTREVVSSRLRPDQHSESLNN